MVKRPYITLKFAQTLDGKIAAEDMSSKWISSKSARKLSHELRAESDAIIVGANTIIADNPSLATRLVKGKNPARIILDGALRIPVKSRVVESAKRIKTIIITTQKASRTKMFKMREKEAELIIIPGRGGNIDIRRIIRILYKKGLKKVLVEGGGRVNSYFLKAGAVDRIVAIICPKLLGSGVNAVGDMGIKNIKKALKLRLKEVKKTGSDIIYTASVK